MDTFSAFKDEPVELPPGFRFHPTDEELITHYLCRKVVDCSFITRIVGEVDLNKVEPWDLPWKARMGEKEWYFFCLRDRKYPTGSRTNRATEAGYWKATGKDKEIFRAKLPVGMKKTLVFYRGRTPKGEKTNWVMHEFRLEGKNSMQSLPKNAKKEWVICRVFKKSSGGKKVHISGLVSHGGESEMPPLMELSCDVIMSGDVSHETSLSIHEDKPYVYDEFSSSSCKKQDSSPFSFTFAPQDSTSNSVFSPEIIPPTQGLSNQDGFLMHDQSILRLLLDENVSKSQGDEMGFDGYDDPIVATAPSDGIHCFWNY